MTSWYIPPSLTGAVTQQMAAGTPYNPYANIYDPYTNPTGSRATQGGMPPLSRPSGISPTAYSPTGINYGPGSSVDSGLLATLRARESQLALERSGLGLASQQLAARQREMAALQAAEKDMPNLIDVGRGLTQQAAYDKRYAMAGLNVPFDILQGPGGPENLPPGVRYRIESEAEKIRRAQEEEDKKRQAAMEAKQLAIQQAGLKVTAAQIEAAKKAASGGGSSDSGGGISAFSYSGSGGVPYSMISPAAKKLASDLGYRP